jgi:hypothetical protein
MSLAAERYQVPCGHAAFYEDDHSFDSEHARGILNAGENVFRGNPMDLYTLKMPASPMSFMYRFNSFRCAFSATLAIASAPSSVRLHDCTKCHFEKGHLS